LGGRRRIQGVRSGQIEDMNDMKKMLITTLLGGWFALPLAAGAADQHNNQAGPAKLKAYPLKTCVVSKEKLGGMGEPFVHKYKDREIKFCCKGCLKDFNKAPEKYVKVLEEAEKKAAR
jgi:YHS domain-containing protein